MKSCLIDGNISILDKEGTGNIVTDIDMKVEKLIITSLKQKYPEAQIISEEAEGLAIVNADLVFIIDPLDGTSNFTKNWPAAISIGVILKNELACGVLYEINTSTVYYAIKGNGAYSYCLAFPGNRRRLENFSIGQRKLEGSTSSSDYAYGSLAMYYMELISHKLWKMGAYQKVIGPISLEALKSGLGDENRPHDYNDICWHVEVRPWDLAAAICIIRELKGEVISLKNGGKPIECKELLNPNNTIAFAASKSNYLLKEFYNVYDSIVNDQVITLKGIMEVNKEDGI